MPEMGRNRKDPDSGLETRVYEKHGAFYYVHRDKTWEPLGKDKAAANRKAKIYNDPDGLYGMMVHWLQLFLLHCEARVAAGTLAKRTLEDYRDAIEIQPDRADGTPTKSGALSRYFAAPMTPMDVTPNMVKGFLTINATLGRSVRGNRDKAALSACFSWLITHDENPGVLVNPCLRGSGVTRNPERKRARYVTDDEYRDVFAMASRSERLLMELTYRTLQRPESDIVLWTTAALMVEDGQRKLHFRQNKTGTWVKIAMSPDLDALLPRPTAKVVKITEPLVRTLKGENYTYDGISSMLRRTIAAANAWRKGRGIPQMQSFGYRDLKGKGATDMWLAGLPIEHIQLLCGHASKATTEIYIKARWNETAQPNMVVMGRG